MLDYNVMYLGLWWGWEGNKADFKDKEPAVGGRGVTLNMVDIEGGQKR